MHVHCVWHNEECLSTLFDGRPDSEHSAKYRASNTKYTMYDIWNVKYLWSLCNLWPASSTETKEFPKFVSCQERKIKIWHKPETRLIILIFLLPEWQVCASSRESFFNLSKICIRFVLFCFTIQLNEIFEIFIGLWALFRITSRDLRQTTQIVTHFLRYFWLLLLLL